MTADTAGIIERLRAAWDRADRAYENYRNCEWDEAGLFQRWKDACAEAEAIGPRLMLTGLLARQAREGAGDA